MLIRVVKILGVAWSTPWFVCWGSEPDPATWRCNTGKGPGAGDSYGCWSPSPTHFAEGLGSSKAKVICFFYCCRVMACVYLWGWEFNSVANDQMNKRTMKSSATAPHPHKTWHNQAPSSLGAGVLNPGSMLDFHRSLNPQHGMKMVTNVLDEKPVQGLQKNAGK